MRIFVFLLICALALSARAQSVIDTDTIGDAFKGGGIYNKHLFSDSLSSSFCIVIKKEVKAHKHVFHTEQVQVLEGTGTMMLDNKTFPVKKGDLIFIPRNTVHAVTSTGKVPLKVLSVQSPRFDGSDRVMAK